VTTGEILQDKSLTRVPICGHEVVERSQESSRPEVFWSLSGHKDEGDADKRAGGIQPEIPPDTNECSIEKKPSSTSAPAAFAPLDAYASPEIGGQTDVADRSHVLVVREVLRLTVLRPAMSIIDNSRQYPTSRIRGRDCDWATAGYCLH